MKETKKGIDYRRNAYLIQAYKGSVIDSVNTRIEQKIRTVRKLGDVGLFGGE